MRRILIGSLALALVSLAGHSSPSLAAGTVATSYFVDASRGSDDATGRSPGTAWRSMDRVNATTFGPGDRILLRAGQTGTGSCGRRARAARDVPSCSTGTGLGRSLPCTATAWCPTRCGCPTSTVPANPAVRKAITSTLDAPSQAAARYLDEITVADPPRVTPKGASDIEKILQRHTEQVLFGQLTPEAAATSFIAELQKEIDAA
jgi:hypothetical protein